MSRSAPHRTPANPGPVKTPGTASPAAPPPSPASDPIVRRREFRWCRRASASPDLSRRILGALADRGRLLLAPGIQPASERGIVEREYAGGEQRGVDGAGLADCERADRNAGGHLDDRIE